MTNGIRMTNQFTDEQVEAGAKAYWLASEREIHDKPITWEWDKEERRRYMWAARQVLAGVAPQAPNAGESTAGLRSRGDIECKPAVQSSSKVQDSPEIENPGAEISIPVLPSSTVDEGKIAEVIAKATYDWSQQRLEFWRRPASVESPGGLDQFIARAAIEAIGGESRGE